VPLAFSFEKPIGSSRVETGCMQRPFAGRAKIQERSDAIDLHIPARKNWFTIIFLGFWLIAVVTILSVALPSFTVNFARNSASPDMSWFFIVWFLGFGGGIAFAAYIWLRMLFGVEIVQVLGDSIAVGQRVLWFEQGRNHSSEHIAHLRTLQIIEPAWYEQSSFYGTGSPSLAFDYGARTVRFGRGIDEAEARQILERIVSKFPQYQTVIPSSSPWNQAFRNRI
jgi:hypothetical protein